VHLNISSFAQSLWLLLWFVVTTGVSAAPVGENSPSLIQRGERLYREGIATAGQPIKARVEGDVQITGTTRLACVSCHRRSGLGSSEGDILIPPITGAALFNPRRSYSPLQETIIEAQTSAGDRPAYTEESLARALRQGLDAGGRRLEALMPRYELMDRDVNALSAYLRTLLATPDPGVDDESMHFATVIMPDASPTQRQALLQVLKTFFHDRNAATRHELRRAQHSPWHKEWPYHSYRHWQLHVWRLSGPADTWPQQLETYYHRQPVFALLGGVGKSPWQPVHNFCQQTGIPCVFPSTDLPFISKDNYYALYFSKGLTLEAETLATYLDQRATPDTHQEILQIYRSDSRGKTVATAFRKALHLSTSLWINDRAIAPQTELDNSWWRRLLKDTSASTIVYWLEPSDLNSVNGGAYKDGRQREHYFSSTLTQWDVDAIPLQLRQHAHLIHPFALQDQWSKQLARTRVWLRAKGIALSDERIQADTYFTATLTQGVIKQIRGNFSRDYFVERLEHMVENTLTPSVYRRLSLGPHQRFASKGAYILTLNNEGTGYKSHPVWITP
jgi:hypothetical protein